MAQQKLQNDDDSKLIGELRTENQRLAEIIADLTKSNSNLTRLSGRLIDQADSYIIACEKKLQNDDDGKLIDELRTKIQHQEEVIAGLYKSNFDLTRHMVAHAKKKDVEFQKANETIEKTCNTSILLEEKVETLTTEAAAEDAGIKWRDSALTALGKFEKVIKDTNKDDVIRVVINYAHVVSDVLQKEPRSMTLRALEDMVRDLKDKNIADVNNMYSALTLMNYGIKEDWWKFTADQNGGYLYKEN